MRIQQALLRFKAVSEGAFSPPIPLLWFIIAAVIAPFSLLVLGGGLPNNFPWYFWTSIPILLLSVVGYGYWRFLRESREREDISIRPPNN